jgi:hypothetical protein
MPALCAFFLFHNSLSSPIISTGEGASIYRYFNSTEYQIAPSPFRSHAFSHFSAFAFAFAFSFAFILSPLTFLLFLL